MKDLTVIRVVLALIIIAVIVFFSVQLQKAILTAINSIGKAIGVKTQGLEYRLQRYMFTNSEHPFAYIYRWVNDQIICLGLKRQGVTVVGFLSFWCIVAVPITFIICVVIKANPFISTVSYFIVVLALLFVTRMRTDSSIEAREATIMDTIDLLVPEIDNGVKNVIMKYLDVIPDMLRVDFSGFIDRLEYKGYTFEDSMTILADDIGGSVFRNFAQKCIYYEYQGDKDMIEVFSDVVDTNRTRRELRESNKLVFDSLKQDFLMASAVVWVYAVAFGFREQTTVNFLFKTTFGQFLLVVDFLIEILVLGFITSIRSKEL